MALKEKEEAEQEQAEQEQAGDEEDAAEAGGFAIVPAPSDDDAGHASAPVTVRALGVLCRSVKAANMFPEALQAVITGLLRGDTTQRLRESAMEFTMWVLKHASDDVLSPGELPCAAKGPRGGSRNRLQPS